jgi:hypothetical protein
MRFYRLLLATSLVGLLCVGIAFSAADASRIPWSEVAGPVFTTVEIKPGDPYRISVGFNLVTAAEGADKAVVEMLDSTGRVIDSRQVGKSKKIEKKVEFAPTSSGRYAFVVTAYRNEEPVPIKSEILIFNFTLPLAAPVVSAMNLGGGDLLVSWQSVPEAQSYTIAYTDLSSNECVLVPVAASTDHTLSKLKIGNKYSIIVTAVRGNNQNSSLAYEKTVKNDKDRVWRFTYFGQSVKGELNRMEMVDSDAMVFKLYSCTFNPVDSQIDQKGGKFTAFHDGISYYYTEIDPATENFELTATFSIDYINITADGQEGFGLLAMDHLGSHAVSMVNHYTNSAGIIATKFEATIAGVKKTSKDTLGARFVTGITPEVLTMGDTGIVQYGKSLSQAYSYDQSDLVKAGDVFTLTLKKTNTGYHAIFAKQYATEETITEYVLYGPQHLLQIDSDSVYVGFAVARGCNATISDVSMKITDPKTDPPAQTEPAVLVPLEARIDSPSTYPETRYPFVFISNADGKFTITDTDHRVLIKDALVQHSQDFNTILTLQRGINDYIVTFSPNPDFKPGERQVLAAYNRELKAYVESHAPVTIMFTVINLTYPGAQLYASPQGSPFGKGTVVDPLDLASAINYAKPGQPIILAGGTYYPTRVVVIERGNSGTESQRKVLRSALGERAVLNFSGASGGMQVWGDYWTIEGIDICETPYNVKGLQIAGNHVIVSQVNTYRCGDTGLQISGSSTEPPHKWPTYNQIINCTSYDNCDPAMNNADGFAAKLTSGEGNVFRGCIAYSNIDDGWDLFTKIETGPIGAVVIEDCVAFRNGSLSDGSGNGDGNGFKLGGDGIAVPHVLRNSYAYANGASGITSNSNPAIILENNLAYGNANYNVTLYGKGEEARLFQVRGMLSLDGVAPDNIKEMPGLASPDNYFWNGATSMNSLGQKIDASIFQHVDTRRIPSRKPDGSIDMGGLFTLVPGANLTLFK